MNRGLYIYIYIYIYKQGPGPGALGETTLPPANPRAGTGLPGHPGGLYTAYLHTKMVQYSRGLGVF